MKKESGGGAMGTGGKTRLSAGILVLAAVLAAPGARSQTADAPATSPRVLIASPALDGPQQAGEAVREIDDPHTGARWLLVRNPEHPGGPGRLVLVEGVRNQPRQNKAGAGPSQAEPRTVIRAGERLIVEESTPVVEARLEAVALGPAVTGSVLEARLRIGGRVVHAVALGPGRAALEPQAEARP
jgi:hypothetical protein